MQFDVFRRDRVLSSAVLQRGGMRLVLYNIHHYVHHYVNDDKRDRDAVAGKQFRRTGQLAGPWGYCGNRNGQRCGYRLGSVLLWHTHRAAGRRGLEQYSYARLAAFRVIVSSGDRKHSLSSRPRHC